MNEKLNVNKVLEHISDLSNKIGDYMEDDRHLQALFTYLKMQGIIELFGGYFTADEYIAKENLYPILNLIIEMNEEYR